MHWMLLPLKRYADFSGRSRRLEFWMWALGQFLVGIFFLMLMIVLGGSAFLLGDPASTAATGAAVGVIWILQLVYSLATLIPYLAVTVRRLHDTDRSGWWVLAPIGPYVLAIVAVFAVAGTGTASSGTAIAVGVFSLVAIIAALALWVVLLVLMFIEGTRGPNRFGADPKQPTHAEVFA